jgi:hypothetical protein
MSWNRKLNKKLIGLVGAILVITGIAIASASPVYMPYSTYGMPMMGWYQGGPYPDENTQKTEFIGNITAVYPMFVVLDNGKSVYLPWWIYNLKPGDVISGEGVEYGWIIPESLEVNGEAIDLPVNQQAPNYPAGYPAGYGMPMMGYGMPMGMMGYGMGYCH